LLLLGACSGVSVKPGQAANIEAYQQRAKQLTVLAEWSLAGKISLDDGDQGGSGRLNWFNRPGATELDFHAALGRGAWNLKIDPDYAVLTESNGETLSARSVNSLIQQRMGWPVPVEALQWWVRGLTAPGMIEEQTIDSDGLLIRLEQFGWTVDFPRYDLSSGVAMPKRLNATMEDYRVKLAVSRWQIPGIDAGQD
jgi:outer membrane lipoprotein LolB